ncbi:glycosyltransferase family 2 protein [Roseospira navarrensis]|uniref:Glycosyltransferase n=1 Tax=Roseospira navarrensis TaxID=140058 RepID=A0A7X1ZGG0_9PROT|nr:glycosyltransferase family 2 protein [Roseospira navarrensis]MQX38015.1 glycosyltransferase [Roseospira navarrensis]
MTKPEALQGSRGLTVIVPCYNEEGGVTQGMKDLIDVVSGLGLPFEILAVDDASEDRTLSCLEAFGDGIRILRNPRNMGYGAALKHGLRKARYDFIAITDADGTYPPEHLPDLVKLVVEEGADMAVGARTGDKVAVPMIRKPAKWFLGRLANFVAGQRIPDINSGLRVFRRDAAMQAYTLYPDGFSFTTTITLAMMTNGFDVRYCRINYLKRIGRSKIHPIREPVNFVLLITRISLYFAPLKLFVPVSLGLVALSIAWGLASYLLLDQFADVTTLILFVTGLQLGVLGMLAEMMNKRLHQDFQKRSW